MMGESAGKLDAGKGQRGSKYENNKRRTQHCDSLTLLVLFIHKHNDHIEAVDTAESLQKIKGKLAISRPG